MQDAKKKMMYETPNRNYYDDPPTRTYEPPTRSYEPRGRSLGRDMAYQPPEKTSVKVKNCSSIDIFLIFIPGHIRSRW